MDLNTKMEKTWCPGCPNFLILEAFKEAVLELDNENKSKIKDTAIVAGIGCHAKIFDYLNLNGFYGLHGRVLPVAQGMKIANPNLTVVGFGGDGDTFAEGTSHFVHACRKNSDMTMIVHDNQVFALTVGQPTPTSEKGFLDGYPEPGVAEKPLNPLALALISGAGFVARGSALDKIHLKDLIKKAIEYKGFSFIDVLQPCIIFHNVVPYFQKNVYKFDETHDKTSFGQAIKKALEWDYCFDQDKPVAIGVFYQVARPTFEDQLASKKPFYLVERQINKQEIIKEFGSL